jgi:HNH/Endo VII superfamily nuclease toxins
LSLHKYLYCADNPVMIVDPSGHEGEIISTMAAIGIGLNVAFAAADAVSAAKARYAGHYVEAAQYETSFTIDVLLLAIPYGGTGGRALATAGRAVSEAELIAAASSKGIKIASWAWAGIRSLIFLQSIESDGGSAPTGDDSVGRSGAFREAKRDSGIPMNQQPDEVQYKLMTDRNRNPIVDQNKQMVWFREYHFTRPDGSKIAIQEHTTGDIAIKQYGPHFNVRQANEKGEVLRDASSVPGTKDHYSFSQ